MTAAASRIDRLGRIEPRIGNVIEPGDTVMSSDNIRMGELFGSSNTSAGVPVTAKSAMRVSAVYAAVRLLSGMIAGVSKNIYERLGPGKSEKANHDIWWLLNERPCPSWSAAAFWEWKMATVLLRGDAIAYISRNRAGVPLAIIPWHRDRVYIERIHADDPRQPSRNRYFFHGRSGSFGAEEDDVLHFPGFGFNGHESMSVIQWGARNGIGIAQRSDEFAGKFFANGGSPQFVVKTDKKMQQAQKDEFTQAWEDKYGGYNVGPNNRPLILTEGLSVEKLSMTGKDAQLLESRQWNVIDIARAFGLPPFMIGEMGKATYNNTENLGVDVVKYTLGPHIKRDEQEINIKLFRMPRFYVKYNVDSLQRGDLVTRGNYYRAAIGGPNNPAWMSVDEVRALEELAPVPGGNELYRPAGDTPGDEPEPPEDPETTPPPPADPAEPETQDEDET